MCNVLPFRQASRLVCLGFALCMSGVLAGAGMAQSGDETAVRALVEQYYQLYAKKDVDGMLSLFSAQAPGYAALKQNWQRQFATEDYRLSQPQISRIKVAGEKANLRAAVKLTVIEIKSRQQREQPIMRNFDLVKEAGSWKVWRGAPAENELAEMLVKATNEAERASLLAAEPELVTVELMNVLVNQGVQFRNQGSFPQALATHRLALRLAEQIGDQSSVANALGELGNDSIAQGDFAQAIEHLQRSLKIFETLRDDLKIAAVLGNIGRIHYLQGDYAQAREIQQKSLKMAEALGDKSRIATTLLNLGNVNRAQGDYPQALKMYQQAIEIVETLGNKARVSGMLNNLGLVYHAQGNYAQALAAYQKALVLDEAVGNKAQMAMKLNNLGNVHSAQGNEAQAQAYYEKALALDEALGDKLGIAINLLNLGNTHRDQGHYAQAMELYQKSLGLSEAMGDKVGIATTLNNLGHAHYEKGDYGLALEHYQKSLTLREALGNKEGIASTLNSLGRLYAQQGRYAQALEAATRAAALARQIGDADNNWVGFFRVGKVQRALKEPVKARRAFEEAIATIETLRANVAGGGADQQRFFSSKVSPYHALVDLLISEGHSTEALNWAERAKARVLLDALQAGGFNITKAMSEQEKEQERNLNSQLVSLNTQAARETARPQPNQARLAELKTQLEKARLDFEAFQTTLASAHPELRGRRGEAPPLKPEELTALLPDTTSALLEYVVTDDRTFLFVINARNGKPVLQTFTLPVTRKDLAAKTEQLRKYFAGRNLGYVEPARALYDLLLKPAAAQLQGKTRLIIVPDGPLWELPFQALMPAANRFLIEDKTISTAPSLTFLREMVRVREKRGKQVAPANILAIGNPALGGEAVLAQRAELMGDKLEPLPFAEQQAVQLGQLYKTNAKVLIGAAATEQAVKAEMGKYRILHLATHGVLDDRNPMYSHLVLAQTGSDEKEDGPKEDGLLEARELLDLDLQADLAVLSACETGRGKIGAGEGMIGLTWALFVAGVPTTVVSQWKVADKSTADLMLAFHRGWQGGKFSKSAALRQASLQLLKTPATNHPFYWAGFVLVGAD